METVTEPLVRILLVEDSKEDADLLRRSLRGEEFEITRVEALAEAETKLRAGQYEVVLLDLSLPDGNGFESFAKIRPLAIDSAVIVLTGNDDEALGLKTVQAGAQDFLVKGTLKGAHMARAIRHSLERKRTETIAQQYARELAARNEEMREDLQLAREVQQAFLPSHCPPFPVGSATPSLHFMHRYVPAGAVGGDFFDVFPLSPEVAGVLMCDVMGHGVRAALVTAMLRALVSPHHPMAHDPGSMLDDLNKQLRTILKSSDNVMFVTAVYLVVNAVTGEVRSANAGHPKPLCVPFGGNVRTLCEGRAVGPPLGLVEAPVYQTVVSQLSAGDRVFLFTDGLYEMEGSQGGSFGQTRLQQELQTFGDLQVEPFLDSLLARLRTFAKDGVFTDDACMLAMDFRRAPTTPIVSLSNHGGPVEPR